MHLKLKEFKIKCKNFKLCKLGNQYNYSLTINKQKAEATAGRRICITSSSRQHAQYTSADADKWQSAWDVFRSPYVSGNPRSAGPTIINIFTIHGNAHKRGASEALWDPVLAKGAECTRQTLLTFTFPWWSYVSRQLPDDVFLFGHRFRESGVFVPIL